jgi:ABC-type sulfate transport system permease component
VLPGFGLTIGYTLAISASIVLIPLSTILLQDRPLGWPQFWAAVASPRTVAAYRLSFGASVRGASINSVFGFIVAWSAGALRISRQDAARCAGRPAVRAADLGRRHHAHRDLRDKTDGSAATAPLGIKVAFTPLGIVSR